MSTRCFRKWLHCAVACLCLAVVGVPAARSAEAAPKVYVILWFDTEDYILPASDDAALRVAEFLTREKIRATFKVVGEKARTLERRGRTDVIDALKKHEIGYHSNFHSVQPTPAMYLSNLGWDDGVAEFDRRERPGVDDVRRIFGTMPTCYGQPGSSWGPQSYGAMRKWGMDVYLDSGNHVRLDDRPFYYCGVLTLYKLAHTLRANLNQPNELTQAEDRFLAARKQLLAEGGGVVSIYYHPCEFVHKEFWDGANFRNGANPPREQWKLPAAKTPEESKAAYEVFEEYVRFIQRFPDVQFVTASETARLYRDKARCRKFTAEELRTIAKGVNENVLFQRQGNFALSAAEVFSLLNDSVASRSLEAALADPPLGPTQPAAVLGSPVTTDTSQFLRTAADVADQIKKEGRLPSVVWLGSTAVPPESFLQALAAVTLARAEGKPTPETVSIPPARLASAKHVADDGPNLWGWIIFPRGFRAPALMEVAKRQAWTLKPAVLERR